MNNSTSSPRLVFADDGTDASDQVWNWIASHRWPGWHVDVMTADADLSHVDWGKPITPKVWEPTWDRDTSGLESKEVRFLSAAADPRAMLAEIHADLVALGIKSSGPLAAAVTGSTTEWLLHHPPSPLAIIKRSEPVRRVLVCVDGSSHANRALQTFASLPLAAGCTVVVLTVDDGRAKTSAADEAADTLQGRVSEVTAVTSSGRPTQAILNGAGDAQADLIVLGTRGLTGWKRLRLGSTASAVVRSTSCDTLVACVDDSERARSGSEPPSDLGLE